jgi:Ca-activated chloride channel family protein
MRSKAFVLCLCLLGFAGAAFAQQQLALDFLERHPGTTDRAPLALHHQVAEVAVQLAVTDVKGDPVLELLPDDLEVFDSGRRAMITALRRDEDLPLRVALVLDWSDSMQKNLNFERTIALDFLRNVLRPETDKAMVVGFRYRVEVTQPLTSNLQSLEAGLRPVAGVSLSSVYDALIAAIDGLSNADPGDQRRAILLLSDGEDNVSAHGLLDAIQAAQRANVTVYTITPLPRRRPNSTGSNVLLELAKVTGGRTFFIPRSAEGSALATIRRDLRTGYALYFKPSPGAGPGLRPLEVSSRDTKLKVRAPHGYYAGSE